MSDDLNMAHCCVCGKPVDTREECDGGGPDGCQLNDGRWVCTSECWDIAVEIERLQEERDDYAAKLMKEDKMILTHDDAGTLSEKLRRAANGIRSFKAERGDFGLADEAADELDRLRAENERLRELVERADGLVDLVGAGWKRACREFCRDASATLAKGDGE